MWFRRLIHVVAVVAVVVSLGFVVFIFLSSSQENSSARYLVRRFPHENSEAIEVS